MTFEIRPLKFQQVGSTLGNVVQGLVEVVNSV